MDETQRDRHVQELAELYRRHFQADSYKQGSQALDQAEALQQRLRQEFGEEYARRVDAAAYRIGHG